MAGHSYKPNSEAIKRRRDTLVLTDWELKILKRTEDNNVGLTNPELAILMRDPDAKRSDESAVRSIVRATAGDQRMERESLMLIALALRMEFDETWMPDESDKVENLIDYMKQFDKSGKYWKAQEIGLHLLSRSKPPLSKTERVEVIVLLSMAYDHDRKWQDALDLLDNMLDADLDLYPWARFQRGLIRRVFAEDLMARRGHGKGEEINKLLDEAREILEFVAETKACGFKVAADHQLAVLLMIDGKFELALAKFGRCLKERLQAPVDSNEGALFRRGYEHRRIAQCHAFLGDIQEARNSFEEAATLAKESNHKRLSLEVKCDRIAWDFLSRSQTP